MYERKRWCCFAYNWMHANLNTTLYYCRIWFCLFYDLVLLIECSYDVDINMYILCCSNRICACPSGRPCLQVKPPSGLCFAGVLINFHSGKYQVLDICPFEQMSCQIFSWILAWLVLEYVGNIEWPGFYRKIIKRYFRLTLSLSRLHHIWEDEESRLLSWGSFLLLLLVLDLCYALGEGGVMTTTDGRKCQRGISEGESPPYMRGRRILTVVVGVASPWFPVC